MTKSRGILAPRVFWTTEQDRILRARYPNERAEGIARDLERPLASVYQRAKKLGLTKSDAFYESDNSGRVKRGKQDPRMRATQFQPGQAPANKGLRRPGWAPGRMASTQFKKGSRGPRWHAIGSHRIIDGVVWVKHAEHNKGDWRLDWKQVHRLVWEGANGPIPKGHVVVFKPGLKTVDPTLITTDRLDLLTYAENMRRNSYHTRYPKEVAQLIQLKGALNRKINRRSKQA